MASFINGENLMAKQRYINTKFWEDGYISNLDPSEKLVFLYMITNSATNISGVYEIPLKRIAVDTGYDKDMIVKIMDRFDRDGKMKYLDGWVAVKNFIKHQATNPKVESGIKAELSKAPEWAIAYIYSMDSLSHLNLNIDSNLIKSNRDSNQEDEGKKPRSQFQKPTVEQIAEYLTEQRNAGKSIGFTADKFYDYYESKGWVVGKSKMKDWKASVRTWINNGYDMPAKNQPVKIDPAARLAELNARRGVM